MTKYFWDERYNQEEFVYGIQPNEYLKEKLSGRDTGKILFVAEGEGRNAVYAAKLGWEVTAFDQSEIGKRKALQWAEKNDVSIDYRISDAEFFPVKESSFDAIAMIYSHFPNEKRKEIHQRISKALKPGGILILEGFSKEHSRNQKDNPTAGGPRNPEMLWDLEELKSDFEGFDFLEAKIENVNLNEGNSHKGKASVVRIFAVKSD